MSKTENNMASPENTPSIDFQIGQKVRFHREKQSLSLPAFSDRVGMKKGAFHKLETGLTRWRVSLLLECAEALNVSFLELLPSDVTRQSVSTTDSSSAQASRQEQDPEVVRMADRLCSLSTNSLRAVEMLVNHFEEIDSSD